MKQLIGYEEISKFTVNCIGEEVITINDSLLHDSFTKVAETIREQYGCNQTESVVANG